MYSSSTCHMVSYVVVAGNSGDELGEKVSVLYLWNGDNCCGLVTQSSWQFIPFVRPSLVPCPSLHNLMPTRRI